MLDFKIPEPLGTSMELPLENCNMNELVEWARKLKGEARLTTLKALWRCLATARRCLTEKDVLARWLHEVLDLTRAERQPLHEAYHASALPGAGQKNCLRLVRWAAPQILVRASNQATVGAALEAAIVASKWEDRVVMDAAARALHALNLLSYLVETIPLHCTWEQFHEAVEEEAESERCQ